MGLPIVTSHGNSSAENPVSLVGSTTVKPNALDKYSPAPSAAAASPAAHEIGVSGGIVSDELLHIFNILNYVVLSVSVSLCGIAANCINIRVFLRQGFKDTINISFFGLAVSDLLVQMVTLLLSVCMNPWYQSINFIAFMGGWTQVILTRITAWITAFLTIERCLCIVMPLKVKDIVTSSRTTAVIGGIFVGATVCVLPVYFTFRIDRVFDPTRNQSLLILVLLKNKGHIQTVMFYLNNVVSPLASFVIVVICTLVLSVSINRNARWRSKFSSSTSSSSNTAKEDSGSKSKEQKVIRMVTACAAIYIVCFTPTIVIFVWSDQDPEFSLTGTYRNLYLLLNSLTLLCQSVNSSVNIFVYYTMSSKYRDTFHALFGKKET